MDLTSRQIVVPYFLLPNTTDRLVEMVPVHEVDFHYLFDYKVPVNILKNAAQIAIQWRVF